MRVTEALLRQNNQKKKKQPVPENGEETQSYKPWSMERWSMNHTDSAFLSPFDDGLNTQGSIFDEQAIFRTERE